MRRDAPNGAASAWREALLLLAPRAGDEALYAAYRARFPNDAEIGARSASLLAGTPGARAPAASNGASPTLNRAATLLREALADERSGVYAAAASKLESAMLLAPIDGTVRIALARQYQQLDRGADAENLLDALLDAQPDMPGALYARAQLFGTQRRWAEGLELLERIAPAQRDAAITLEQRKLWIGAQLERARQMAVMGDRASAAALVSAAQDAAGVQAALLAPVAAAWSDIGNPGQGLRLLRERLSDGAAQADATRLDYAQILLDGFEDAELGAVLRDLATPGRLTPAQQATRDRIALVHSLRQAEKLRESGRLDDAAARLAPLMRRADDTRPLLSMARLRQAASEPAAALLLVEQAIARQGGELGHRLLACDLALALNDPAKAGAHAAAALALAPRHPRALASAGRVARARGNLPEAHSYFQRARAAERDGAAFVGAPGSHALRLLDDEAAPALPGASKTP